VLNLIMFIPLGALLAIRGVPLRVVALAAFVPSVLIEGAQIPLEGRDASLGDVLFNTVGGMTGLAVAGLTLRQLASGSRATVGPVVMAAITLGLIGGTGLLLEPAFPASAYYGQWTANLGHLEWYRGRVRGATLEDIPLPSDRLGDSRRVRELLLAGERLDVLAVAGPRVPRLAPLFSIYDDRQREIVLLGPDRDDLVLRYRTRGITLRLDQPDLRLRGAFAHVSAGDTLRIAAWRATQGYCLTLNQASTCGLGFTAGRGWGTLLYAERFPAWLKGVLDVGWLVGLLGLVGLAGTRRTALAAGGAAIALGLGVVAPAVGLTTTPMGEWIGAGFGLIAGVGLRAVLAPILRET